LLSHQLASLRIFTPRQHLLNSWAICGVRDLKLVSIRGGVPRATWRAAMNLFESLPSEAAIRRLVLARVVAGLIVVVAIVVAPPVVDSIATLDLSASELAEFLDDGEPWAEKGIDVQETKAAPVEPLTMSY
jgi:hypothetical protein